MRGSGNLRGRGSSAAVEIKEESPKPKRKPGRPSRRAAAAAAAAESDAEASPAPKAAKTKPGRKPGRPPKGGQAKSVTSRRLNNTAESADYVDEAAFKNFDYRLDGVEDYTPERCAELEQHYWKSLSFNQPMYAADMPGSLFDDTVTSWNVAHLPNLLDVLGTKVPGVNTAYLYMGMWKATFAWHLEDVDLYSINYIHFGAPKQWYSISQEDARKFEAAMRQVWPVDAKSCDQFLRHKTYLISPDVLQKQYGVKVNKLVHNEGEFVITYPYGYHSGFNLGYNCAESVNFATESWLEFGRIARKCNCEADNVWVDVSEIERKLRGEPTPEYTYETDDEDDGSDEEDGNLPSPPASVRGKPARGKKRKREMKEEKAPKKKKKKIRIKVRVPTREPCAMCPNDNPWEPLLPTDTGKKAHRCCALYTPETWIEKQPDGAERVYGVATIDKARLELKCNFCRSKRGACFQCSSKKCTRAFHASCAVAAGVLVDGGLVPTFGEDGTEYFEEGFDFRCKFHRPKQEKYLTVEKVEAGSKWITAYAKELKPQDTVQVQYIGAEVFGGLVVENRPAEQSVVVDVLPEGYVGFVGDARLFADGHCSDRVEVEWKWLCLLDPDDSLRPKPSAAALKMPKGMNKEGLSINNRQDGVPELNDVFHDNPDNKWCNFYNMHTPPPGFISKQLEAAAKLPPIKLDMPETFFHYLPTISTEAKPMWTEKAGTMMVANKANFLDRVTPRPPVPTYNATFTRPNQHLAAAPGKVPIAQARPGPAQSIASFPPRATSSSTTNEKPYVYKPKDPPAPRTKHNASIWSIDQNALATQREFLADAQRRSTQQFNLPQPNPGQGSGWQGTDPGKNKLRPFSREHYYSAELLPAAVHGEYSTFTEVARRQSQSSGSGPALEYRSVKEQMAMQKQAQDSRPFSSTSGMAGTKETVPEYLENLQKYPYLKNCFLRRPVAYVSPYAADGGFNLAALEEKESAGQRQSSGGFHTPNASVSGAAHEAGGQQWTPPSQTWNPSGRSQSPAAPLPPMQTQRSEHRQQQQQQQQQQHQQQQVMYQTPSEFRQSWSSSSTSGPGASSRDGAEARLLRDQGYGFGRFAPHGYLPQPNQQTQQQQQHRNSFGSGTGTAGGALMYDTAKLAWQSPKAPKASPLSDPNTPWSTLGARQREVGTPPVANMVGSVAPTANMTGAGMAMQRQGSNGSGSGYQGPPLPRMDVGTGGMVGGGVGHETWKYG